LMKKVRYFVGVVFKGAKASLMEVLSISSHRLSPSSNSFLDN
jgi:hypothetical protein